MWPMLTSVTLTAFWRDDRLKSINESMTKQIAVCARLKFMLGKPLLSNALVAMIDCIEDDSLLKTTNIGVLMQTRSDDPRLRLYAITCAVAIWQEHGKKLASPYYILIQICKTKKSDLTRFSRSWTRNCSFHNRVCRGRKR